MPRWVVANENEDSESSSEDETEEEEEEEVEESVDAEADGEPGLSGAADHRGPGGSSAGDGSKKQKLTIPLGRGGLVCHVCGKRGHNAGFVGSVYMDCPNKPCYLCKKPGHTTMSCPYRVAPDHDCAQASSVHNRGILASLLQRSNDSRPAGICLPPLSGWQVDAAVLKLHSRRCTCLQFIPGKESLVLSGDKAGQVAVWDFNKVHERTVWRINRALTNNLSFLPSVDGMSCCSASSDGTLKVFDVETGLDRELLNMNPDGWVPGVSNERNWVMVYGMDVCRSRKLVAAGDSHGNVHFVDARMEKPVGHHQLHKKGNKVTSIQFNPADQDLMVSASNDWTARLNDIRRMSSSAASPGSKGKEVASGPMELARIEHPKVVNSAYFSPLTGRKLMTTCIDNRIRIWDYLLSVDGAPDREIVHSHDFNRYLTPFRAEWDPKDPDERLFVIGRYISEDFGGTALHPVDLMDAGTGKLLDQLKDPNLATICPVNKIHPTLDIIISGSSRSLYAWRPTRKSKEDVTMVTSSSRKASDKQEPLQGSANYVFYDAGGNDDSEKTKRKKASVDSTELDDMPDKPHPKNKSFAKQKVQQSAKSKAQSERRPRHPKSSSTKKQKPPEKKEDSKKKKK